MTRKAGRAQSRWPLCLAVTGAVALVGAIGVLHKHAANASKECMRRIKGQQRAVKLNDDLAEGKKPVNAFKAAEAARALSTTDNHTSDAHPAIRMEWDLFAGNAKNFKAAPTLCRPHSKDQGTKSRRLPSGQSLTIVGHVTQSLRKGKEHLQAYGSQGWLRPHAPIRLRDLREGRVRMWGLSLRQRFPRSGLSLDYEGVKPCLVHQLKSAG